MELLAVLASAWSLALTSSSSASGWLGSRICSRFFAERKDVASAAITFKADDPASLEGSIDSSAMNPWLAGWRGDPVRFLAHFAPQIPEIEWWRFAARS